MAYVQKGTFFLQISITNVEMEYLHYIMDQMSPVDYKALGGVSKFALKWIFGNKTLSSK